MLLFAVSVLFNSGTLMKLDLLQFPALCSLKEKKNWNVLNSLLIYLQFQFTFSIIQIPKKSFDISSFVTVTVLLIQVALN